MLTLTIDGRPHPARDGDTVAATLLAAGMSACRTTPVTGSARGPFCMMGVCFDCLVVIDGHPNRQSCMTVAREGMRIERQQGARVVAADDTSGPGA
jgi:predicted molibdopterin-dependent oxidoreductase YjgC